MNLYYGDFHALKDVNLEIEANKITAFIGPSGCGKSTLLKSINRMNDLVEGCRIEGSLLLDGEDIYKDIDVNLLRKRVGMVFQKPNPFPMSIYDNIAYGIENNFSVSLYSTTSPNRKNAVLSETRTACCILCVTMTIV